MYSLFGYQTKAWNTQISSQHEDCNPSVLLVDDNSMSGSSEVFMISQAKFFRLHETFQSFLLFVLDLFTRLQFISLITLSDDTSSL